MDLRKRSAFDSKLITFLIDLLYLYRLIWRTWVIVLDEARIIVRDLNVYNSLILRISLSGWSFSVEQSSGFFNKNFVIHLWYLTVYIIYIINQNSVRDIFYNYRDYFQTKNCPLYARLNIFERFSCLTNTCGLCYTTFYTENAFAILNTSKLWNNMINPHYSSLTGNTHSFRSH